MEQQTDTSNENYLRKKQILDAACREFIRHGKSGTRMQQIADNAGVNKALVYYYYHSKDEIFHAVVEQNFKLLIETMSTNVDFSAPLKTIVRQFTHNHIHIIAENRELFQFFSGEIWMNPEALINGISEDVQKHTEHLYGALKKRIEEAACEHEIRQIQPLQFLLNVISLDIFYFIAAPIVFSFTGTKPAEQKRIAEERENEVFNFVWESIRYHGDESDSEAL
ncbi:MAG: TetR/AcrR family transcriptional regulator [Treponema sp.]